MTERDDILRRVEERAEKILASAPRSKTHWWIIGGGAAVLAVIAVFLIFGRNTYSIKDSNNATIIGSANNVTISNTQTLKLYGDLPQEQKEDLKAKAYAFFPEILNQDYQNYQNKYKRFSMWMGEEQGVNQKDTRNIFSSGGKSDITVGGKEFVRVARVVVNLWDISEEVKDRIIKTDGRELSKRWGNYPPDDGEKRIRWWAEQAGGGLSGVDKEAFDAIVKEWLIGLESSSPPPVSTAQ